MSDPTSSLTVPAALSADLPAFPTVRLDQLAETGVTGPDWLVHGYLARGNLTLLTSQWKMGKTTLLAVLLERMRSGGQLAGLAVQAGKAVVVSEEGAEHWAARARRLGLGKHVYLVSRPFLTQPGPQQWQRLLEYLADLHRAHGLDLVVIDSLASLLPAQAEASSAGVMQALMPLQWFTARGLGVLLLHHPRKGPAADGQAARGPGAFSSYVDVLVEMHWYGRGREADRRRRLLAWSRHEATPRQLVIELSADGRDYLAHGDFEEEDYGRNWPVLRAVLAQATHKLTRAEILDAWPAEQVQPSPVTLARWVNRAAAQGLLLQEGGGRSADPFRYWLPGQEEVWQLDPVALLENNQIEALRLLHQQLGAPPEPPPRRRRR